MSWLPFVILVAVLWGTALAVISASTWAEARPLDVLLGGDQDGDQ